MRANDLVGRPIGGPRRVDLTLFTMRTEEICDAIHDVDDSQGI